MYSNQRAFCCLVFIVILCSMGSDVMAGDDKNITRLLNNQVIVSRQIMCVLEKSPCDQLGRQLKGRMINSKLFLMNFKNNYRFLKNIET